MQFAIDRRGMRDQADTKVAQRREVLITQHITSAQEFLRGRSLYPSNMEDLMRADFEEEPPPLSLGRWSPALAERERQEREDILQSDWKQAHPPLMSLAVAPLVATVGS